MRSIYSSSMVWFHASIAAFQLLTTIYIPVKISYTDAVSRRSVVFYPWVGACIGLLLFTTAWIFATLLPSAAAGVCLLIVWVFLTGALHLDGLLDTADGLLSRQSRDKMLQIMKDSRIGAMGAVVCVLYLLLKASLLISLFSLSSPTMGFIMIIFIPIWSRWFMVWTIISWPYTRTNEGMGAHLSQARVKHAMMATVGAVLLTAAVIILLQLTHVYNWNSLILLISGFITITTLIGWLISVYLNRKLGGLTGDTYGAVNEILELVLLFYVICVIGYF